MSSPNFIAIDLRISKTPATPSEICDAFPAVVTPVSLTNAGRIFCNDSSVTPLLGPSSRSILVPFGNSMGRISSLKSPFDTAFSAFRNDSSANRSCSSLEMPNFLATFSLVSPIGIKQLAALLSDFNSSDIVPNAVFP